MRNIAWVLGIALLMIGKILSAEAASGVATFYANVTGPGTVASSSGVHASSHPSTGVYNLTFNRTNNGCAPSATISGGATNVGYAVVERVSSTEYTVRTYSGSSAALSNLAFTILVLCLN
jgi:hypothetical protein